MLLPEEEITLPRTPPPREVEELNAIGSDLATQEAHPQKRMLQEEIGPIYFDNDESTSDVLNKYNVNGVKCDWKKVRFVPSGSTWHPAKDNLAGTELAYGDSNSNSAAWNIPFSNIDFSIFLFATGDFRKWLITEKKELLETGYYDNLNKKILRSSDNHNSETSGKM